MPGRSPLTAYGNVRVGPPAMSLIHSQFFSDCISAVQETQLQPKRVLQAESEGAFFSSESVEKKRTGWFDQSRSTNRRNANQVGWFGQSVSPQNRKNDNPNGQVGQSLSSIGKRVVNSRKPTPPHG